MAKTSVAEVLRAWGKLGYPRRAMRLHECATVLARDYDDQVPGDVETLLTLPGVGPRRHRGTSSSAR
ncbi:A/G-specific adenine glycosylase, putative [Mycobacteroides abscessus subsp. abscessus]|nr:A/G-specific adenine glycosylase, putative [Mycobacteroides abscessus subsp. abscessus]